MQSYAVHRRLCSCQKTGWANDLNPPFVQGWLIWHSHLSTQPPIIPPQGLLTHPFQVIYLSNKAFVVCVSIVRGIFVKLLMTDSVCHTKATRKTTSLCCHKTSGLFPLSWLKGASHYFGKKRKKQWQLSSYLFIHPDCCFLFFLFFFFVTLGCVRSKAKRTWTQIHP